MARNNHHAHAGFNSQKATQAAKQRGEYCSLIDIDRACHRWLMKHDPVYRQQSELTPKERTERAYQSRTERANKKRTLSDTTH